MLADVAFEGEDGQDADREARDVDEMSCTPLARGDEAIHARLRAGWTTARPLYEASLRTSLDARNTTGLYTLQLVTNPLLLTAEAHADLATLEELATTYAIAFEYLETYDRAVFYFVPPPVGTGARTQVLPLARPARMWTRPPDAEAVGAETTLDVAQFAASLARLVRIAAEVGEVRSPVLAEFAREVAPWLATDTYRRWIERAPGQPGHFQRRGWGCNSGAYGHREVVQHLLSRAYGTDALPDPASNPVGYCNVVTDTDLWILVGALELTVAHRRDPALVPLTPELLAMLESHARDGAELIQRRLTTHVLEDGQGVEVSGRQFESGSFDEHPDLRYAGDTDPSYPGISVAGGAPARPPTPAVGVGWDLSHARRLVHVFDSYRRFARDVGVDDFDGDAIVAGLARQLVFGASNGDCSDPKFTNFFDGTNGWYRVNYSGRVGFGYAPYAMTDSVVGSGYGLWGELCPELGELVRCLFDTRDDDDASSADGARSLVAELPSVLPYGPREAHCGW